MRAAVDDEIRWRGLLVLSTLMYCRAVARLPASERAEVEVLSGCSLAEVAKTGEALLKLSDVEVMALLEQLDNPWDHAAMRGMADALQRGGLRHLPSLAFRSALLRRVREATSGRS